MPEPDTGVPGEARAAEDILVVQDLGVRYGRVEAVRGVSLTVARGSLVTLVGANGAGKTSVINAVSGVLRPSSGTIMYDGQDITRAPAHRLVRRGLVQVPEGRQILGQMSVEDNMRMGAWHSGQDGRGAIDEVYDRFRVLADRRSQLAGSLSGGEQQMLAIGRALAARPRLILMDEPSMGLAPKVADEVFAVIEQIRTSGTTVLLVEQNARRALRAADAGYVIASGEIAASGPAEELLADEGIVEAYLGLD